MLRRLKACYALTVGVPVGLYCLLSPALLKGGGGLNEAAPPPGPSPDLLGALFSDVARRQDGRGIQKSVLKTS